MSYRKQRRQPPAKGGRASMSPCVLHSIEMEIMRLANVYGVSRSWVISTVLADSFGIKEQPSFYATKIRRVK